MRDGLMRIQQAVRDLKSFSRSDGDARRPVGLQEVLDPTIDIAFNEIRHRARLVKEYLPTPRVHANESRLGQVFLNLLINAAQAIPDGAADRNEIRVRTFTDALGHAVVEIRDTGGGIPPEHVGRIFEPFFTTKPAGVGTGLGLSICQNLVMALGGTITAENAPERGSTFRVTLPPAPELAGLVEADAGTPAAAAPPRRARLLVVDDDPNVARAIRRTLAREHEVTVDTDPRAALRRIAGGERFDLVVSDLMMPDMSGMALHAELAARGLGEQVLFLTGGAFTPQARAFLASVPNPRLEKPFDGAVLRALVAKLVS
jgi:CheY-like chemotaxis protein